MNLYGEYSRTCDFSRILSSLNFARNDLCATSDKNINFSISKQMLGKVGISNSLCNRIVFKLFQTIIFFVNFGKYDISKTVNGYR